MPYSSATQCDLQPFAPVSAQARAIVHVIDTEGGDHPLPAACLASLGVELRTYACLGAFLDAGPGELPSCLIVDANAIAPEHSVVCPIVATTYRSDVATVVNAMKRGAIDVLEKPLREREIVAAVQAALDADRQQRLAASRTAELHSRFAKLSPRERQVMALVTTGRLNKQVGGDLGLSEITVKAHRGAAMRKMGARSLADLVRMADAIGEDVARVRSGCSEPVRTAAA